MLKNKSIVLVISGALLTSSIAYADFGDFAVGAVIGGVASSVITHSIDNKRHNSHNRRYRRHRRHVVHHRQHHVVHHEQHKLPVITPDVKVQKALKALGFYHAPLNGELNSYETRSAIKSMNNSYEIGNNASLDPKTKDALIYLSDLFTFDRLLISRDNSKRSENKKIQTALKIYGFYHSTIDGLAGSGTKQAIAKYKSSKNLSYGDSLNLEEKYQLTSSAKKINDKNIDDTIASIKNTANHNYTNKINSKTTVLQPSN